MLERRVHGGAGQEAEAAPCFAAKQQRLPYLPGFFCLFFFVFFASPQPEDADQD